MPKQIIGNIWHFYYCLFKEEANIQHETTLCPSNFKKLSVNCDIYNSHLSSESPADTCEKVKSQELEGWVWLFGMFRCLSLFTGLKSSWVPNLGIWLSLGSRDLHWGLWSSGLHHSTFIFGSKMGFGCGSEMIPSRVKRTPRFSVLSSPLWLHCTWTEGFLL